MNDSIQIVVLDKPEGVMPRVQSLVDEAWIELPELKYTDLDKFKYSVLRFYQDMEAVEIIAMHGNAVAGACGVALSADLHVGDCAVVLALYVSPAFTGMGIAGKLIETAKGIARETFRVPVMSFTHRVNRNTYTTRYVDTGLEEG